MPFRFAFVRFAAFSLLAATASAQFVAHPDETLTILPGSAPGTLEINWFGHAGRAYFLKHSSALETGVWSYLPVIEKGLDAPLAYGLSAPVPGGRLFARTVVVPSATATPATEDSDGDGVPNLDELQAGLDPLASADTDSDGLPDDWERFYFGDLSRDGSADFDADGLSDSAEFTAGRHPNTSIVYGTIEYRYARQSTDGLTVYMKDYRDQNTLSVTYTDATRTVVESIAVHPGVETNDHFSLPWWFENGLPPTSARYTREEAGEGGHTLRFEPLFCTRPLGGDILEFRGQDLLRKIDGRPYVRRTVSGQIHRVAAYLAITNQPFDAITPKSFPAIVRDFPYEDTAYRDFGFGFREGSKTGWMATMLDADGLPVPQIEGEDTERRIYSAESFNQWFRKPDATNLNMGLQADQFFDSGYEHGFVTDNYFPFTHVLPVLGGGDAPLTYTAELYATLTYDVGASSLAPTRLSYRSDDDLLVYLNGRLIIEVIGVTGGSGTVTLRDLPHGLTTDTGTCELAIFHAERFTSHAQLTLQSTTPLTPIYVCQIVADSLADGTRHFELGPGAPAGMSIHADTGKIKWNYVGLPHGDYPFTVLVRDGRQNIDSQSVTLTLGEIPVFTSQPSDYQSIPVGQPATLSAATTAVPGPVAYQWYKDGVPLPGETSATLAIPAVATIHEGNYRLKATNKTGSSLSDYAYLSVFSPYEE